MNRRIHIKEGLQWTNEDKVVNLAGSFIFSPFVAMIVTCIWIAEVFKEWRNKTSNW